MRSTSLLRTSRSCFLAESSPRRSVSSHDPGSHPHCVDHPVFRHAPAALSRGPYRTRQSPARASRWPHPSTRRRNQCRVTRRAKAASCRPEGRASLNDGGTRACKRRTLRPTFTRLATGRACQRSNAAQRVKRRLSGDYFARGPGAGRATSGETGRASSRISILATRPYSPGEVFPVAR